MYCMKYHYHLLHNTHPSSEKAGIAPKTMKSIMKDHYSIIEICMPNECSHSFILFFFHFVLKNKDNF